MTSLVIEHAPIDIEALSLDRAIAEVAMANIAKDRREQDAIRESARLASLEVYRRAQREKALRRGARFFSLAFVLMMGVAVVYEMRLGGVL